MLTKPVSSFTVTYSNGMVNAFVVCEDGSVFVAKVGDPDWTWQRTKSIPNTEVWETEQAAVTR